MKFCKIGIKLEDWRPQAGVRLQLIVHSDALHHNVTLHCVQQKALCATSLLSLKHTLISIKPATTDRLAALMRD